MHVFKEMLELCQIVNSEGYPQTKEDPTLKFIPFGELFNVSYCITMNPPLLMRLFHNLI